MRRFRFIGDPKQYNWDDKPVVYQIYPETHTGKIKSMQWESKPLSRWDDPELLIDWQEVFDGKPYIREIPKPLHKDTDLGYFSGLAMQGQFSQIEVFKRLFTRILIKESTRKPVLTRILLLLLRLRLMPKN